MDAVAPRRSEKSEISIFISILKIDDIESYMKEQNLTVSWSDFYYLFTAENLSFENSTKEDFEKAIKN
jgi:hypothetical protein